MKKYRIELSEEQMRIVCGCLDDISRFAAGQVNLNYTISEMLRGLPIDEHLEKRDQVEAHLSEIKRILLPDHPSNASKGYNGSPFIGNIYQIYRIMMYQLAIDNNWDNVYSSPALPSGTMGTIKVEQIE
jgi:hypothetical protein